MHKLPEFDKHAALAWDTANELYISGVGTLVCKKLAEGVIFPKVVVKFRQGGEACQIPGRQGHHSLKNLMQENQIPPWLRDRTPIIYRSNEILAIPGIFTADKNTLFLLQRE